MGHTLKQVRLKCIEGIKVKVERCREHAEQSLSLITALAPKIGCSRAAQLARESSKGGKTIRQLLDGKGVLSTDEINDLLNLDSLAGMANVGRRIKK
jgi:fumarate hydratase class II